MEQNLPATLGLLAATPNTLDALLRPLPSSFTQQNEGGDTWTIPQVLAHLIHGERTDWLPRIRIILRAGESEPFPAFNRQAHLADTRPIPDLLTEFAHLRAASVAELQALNLTPHDLERRGHHPVFGPVTLSQLLATWPVHDLTHLHQITRVLAAQYREAVGPWNRYLGVLRCDGHSEKA